MHRTTKAILHHYKQGYFEHFGPYGLHFKVPVKPRDGGPWEYVYEMRDERVKASMERRWKIVSERRWAILGLAFAWMCGVPLAVAVIAGCWRLAIFVIADL